MVQNELLFRNISFIYQIINFSGGPYTQCPQASFSCMEVDSETDSNHDTALTVACAGGHEELVELLLSRGADIGNYHLYFIF